MQTRVTVLEYHKIGSPPCSPGWGLPPDWTPTWYTPEAKFADELLYLREEGWKVVNLTAFLDGLEAPNGFSERSVLLTFDDGYRSLRDVALPVLRDFGYPAVVFMPTKFIGGYNDFDRDREPKEEMCTWEDLQELERYGVSVQSHGVSHAHFCTLNDSDLLEEIKTSKEILQSKLGTRIEALSYPYGGVGKDFQTTSKALRHAGYRAAFLAEGGPLSFPIDVYRLNRLLMFPRTDLHRALLQ